MALTTSAVQIMVTSGICFTSSEICYTKIKESYGEVSIRKEIVNWSQATLGNKSLENFGFVATTSAEGPTLVDKITVQYTLGEL